MRPRGTKILGQPHMILRLEGLVSKKQHLMLHQPGRQDGLLLATQGHGEVNAGDLGPEGRTGSLKFHPAQV